MDPIKYGKALKFAGKRNKLKFEAWENHDHHEFLSKINQNPQDVFAHDVYADWLQDQGKDLHAEIIRKAARPSETHSDSGSLRKDTSNWNTASERWSPSDFGVSAWKNPEGTWNVDLGSQHHIPDALGGVGSRRIWTLNNLPASEASRVYHGLLSEGAGGANEGVNVPPLPQQVTNAGLQ